MSRLRRLLGSLAALALASLGSGCATIVQGSTQMIQVTTEPPGASVLVLPEKASFVTPGEVDLKRDHVHTLVFDLPCHAQATGYLDRLDSKTVLLNLILGGLIGMFIDLDSGAAYRLDPDPLHVTLVRLAADCDPSKPPPEPL